MTMKILIAAACVCVIAATGYYLVSEYRGSVAAAAEAKEAHQADCLRTAQRGYELQNSRMISKGERCLAGIE